MDRADSPSSILRVFFFTLAWVLVAVTGIEAQERAQGGSETQREPLAVEKDPWLKVGIVEGDPDYQLYQVVTAFLLPGDKLAIALASSGEIRVFASDGRFLASLGRLGEGPGEFGELSSAWARGDTIEAYDGGLQRVTRFHPDGTAETVNLNWAGIEGRPNLAIPGDLDDGWAMIGITGFIAGRRDQVAVFHFARDGSYQRVLAQVGGILRDYRARGPIPLSPSASFAIAGGAVFVGETLTPSISVVDLNGTVVKRITWTQRQVSAEEAHREVVRLAVERAEPADRQSARQRLREAQPPEKVPLFSSFLVDEEGFVWVRPYEVGRDAAALGGPLYTQRPVGGLWRVFGPDGAETPSIELPPGLEVSQVTTSAVVGIRRDELGVEYVQVYRLLRK